MSDESPRFETVSVPLEYPPEVQEALDEALEAAKAARERMLDDVETALGPEARTRLEAAEANALALMSDAILYGVTIVDTQGRRVDPTRVYSVDREPTLGRSPLETLTHHGGLNDLLTQADHDDLLLEWDRAPVLGPRGIVDVTDAQRRLGREEIARAFEVPRSFVMGTWREDPRTRTPPHGDPLR